MARRLFLWGSWVPAALWVATLVYIRPYDGWGAWAAAPLLVPSVLLSMAWAFSGVAMLVVAAVKKRPIDVGVLVATLIGGSVIAYYTFRYYLRPIG